MKILETRLRGSGGAGIPVASTVLAALIPKCPMCVAAWGAAFGAVSLPATDTSLWIAWTALWSVALCVLGWRCFRCRVLWPFCLAVLAVVLAGLSRAKILPEECLWSSLLILMLSVVFSWNKTERHCAVSLISAGETASSRGEVVPASAENRGRPDEFSRG